MPPDVTKADRPCKGCGRFMLTQRRWWAYSGEEREKLLVDGFACHGVGDKCKSCAKHKGKKRRVHIDYKKRSK